jgi:hypothetical protein
VSDARRMVLGATVAAVVIGYGAAHQFGAAWGAVLALCAVMVVAAVALLGDQLGRRRASGN